MRSVDARPKSSETPAGPAVQRFGKYFLVDKLAEGGMAEIFLAKQVGAEGFERNVVIKRMLRHLSSLPDFVGMFLDEARLAARLAHQNIIQINDLGLADGCYYICMEYLAGEDFSNVLRTTSRRREYVPLTVTLRVIADAAHGLHFAHTFTDESGKPLNIVHRDISPSNIYVTYQGQVKLLDFGIAKAESRITNTTAGVVKGKYMYMAPEQARGAPVDRRADVFSLGVSLYEALTNVRPFSKDNDLAVLNSVLKCDFLPPRRVRPDLPAELEAVVMKAMAPKVEDRYQTCDELANDLERFLSTNTSSTGGAMVADYMRNCFGAERITKKTRIPTLHSLGVAPPTPGETTNGRGAAPPVLEGASATMVVTGRKDVSTPRSASEKRSRAVAWVAVSLLLLGAGLGGGFYLLSPRTVRPPEPPQGPVVPPMGALAITVLDMNTRKALENAQVSVIADGVEQQRLLTMQGKVVLKNVRVGDVSVRVRRDGYVAGETQATVVRDAELPLSVLLVPEPKAQPPPGGQDTAATPSGPVRLNPAMIQKVVDRGKKPIMSCFDVHKADLPTDQGEVGVQFSISSSGKVVNAAVKGPLAGAAVAGCLQDRVSQLKFPRHVDREITLNLPLQYRVSRQ